jgi:hypothetical protein
VVVEIVEERDTSRGWEFLARLDTPRGPRDVVLLMSWVDCEHWSRGGAPPADVAREVLRLLVERDGLDSLPDRFDAARLRRLHPDSDDALRDRL